ncbi:copper-binding protein [Castellaniella sp.]|uniref:copper-binding protein n=1 Tax=Castellaniella sp. TaxID=1955812 RepID=UPI002B003758|nr:copper-binding protein [Castellaniella sp.]
MRFRVLRTRFLALACALPVAGGTAVSPGALALAAAGAWSLPGAARAAAPVQARASGEVVRVNAPAGKIAIRHGAIDKLDLPAMTLVYHVDPALLAGIAVGDRVEFTAERTGGQYRIVELKK